MKFTTGMYRVGGHRLGIRTSQISQFPSDGHRRHGSGTRNRARSCFTHELGTGCLTDSVAHSPTQYLCDCFIHHESTDTQTVVESRKGLVNSRVAPACIRGPCSRSHSCSSDSLRSTVSFTGRFVALPGGLPSLRLCLRSISADRHTVTSRAMTQSLKNVSNTCTANTPRAPILHDTRRFLLPARLPLR